MRKTAKRLLFLLFLFLYYSIMFDYASAQTESSNPLSACFQTHALNQKIPVQVHFQLYAGGMFSTEILDTTLIYIKQKRQYQYQLSSTTENLLPENLFQELFIAINNTPWSSEPVPKTIPPLHSHIDWNLSFKLSTGQEFSLFSKNFSPSSKQGFNPAGPWFFRCESSFFEAYSFEIGQAVMKILSQLNPALEINAHSDDASVQAIKLGR